MARRHYLLEHDVDSVPTHFPWNEFGLRSAVMTAESHAGAELYVTPAGKGIEQHKALCKRAEVWLLDGKGRKLELVFVATDGVLQGGKAPVRGRTSALAERLAA